VRDDAGEDHVGLERVVPAQDLGRGLVVVARQRLREPAPHHLDVDHVPGVEDEALDDDRDRGDRQDDEEVEHPLRLEDGEVEQGLDERVRIHSTDDLSTRGTADP
jgi:hypothetical protein